MATTSELFETASNAIHALSYYLRSTFDTTRYEVKAEPPESPARDERWVVFLIVTTPHTTRTWRVGSAWGEVTIEFFFRDGVSIYEKTLGAYETVLTERADLAGDIIEAIIGRRSIPAVSRRELRQMLDGARRDAEHTWRVGSLALSLEGPGPYEWSAIEEAGRANYAGLYGYLRTTGVAFDALPLYDQAFEQAGRALAESALS